MMFFFTGGLSICQPFVHEPPLISLAFYKGNCFWNGSQDIPIGHNNCSPPPSIVSFHFLLIVRFIFVPSFSIFFSKVCKNALSRKTRRIEPYVASSFDPDRTSDGWKPNRPFSQALKRELQEMTLKRITRSLWGFQKKRHRKNTKI